MLKIIAFFKFRDDKPVEQCRDYWLNEHARVVRKCLPEARKYVQNPPILISSREWEWDGISELWFDDMDSIKRSFEGVLADELREDEAQFVGENVSWIIANEDTIFDVEQVPPRA